MVRYYTHCPLDAGGRVGIQGKSSHLAWRPIAVHLIMISGVEHGACVLLLPEELRHHVFCGPSVRRGAAEAVRNTYACCLTHSHYPRPLDLSRVAELKSVSLRCMICIVLNNQWARALLPDTVKFAYIPKTELRIHAESQERRDRSPDYAQYSSQAGPTADDDDHVLVLDLQENSRGKKNANTGFVHAIVTLTTQLTECQARVWFTPGFNAGCHEEAHQQAERTLHTGSQRVRLPSFPTSQVAALTELIGCWRQPPSMMTPWHFCRPRREIIYPSTRLRGHSIS